MSDDARKLLQDIEEYLNFSSQDSYYAEWLREVKLRITALLSAPAPEPVAGFDLASKPDITAEVTVTINSAPAPEPVGFGDSICDYVKEYVQDYVFEGDEGCYTPKEHERHMIEDAIHGMLADDDFRSHFNPPASSWVRCEDKLPKEGENIWIGGHGKNGPFYADAKYENGAWLMFDQETDQHCWPCVNPDYWMPIQPLPPLPEDKQ